jgi:hypothetical protein
MTKMKLSRILNGALNASLVAVVFSTAAAAQLPSPFTPFTPPKAPVTIFAAAKAATPKKAAVVPAATATTTAAAPAASFNPLAQIQAVTLADVQAGIADATSHNDTRHLPCWQAMLPIVQNNELIANLPVHLPTAVGVVELAQTYFDAKAGIGNLQASLQTTLDPLVTACALTMVDLQMGVLQLAGLVGLKVAPLALPAGL